jgi:hypothetical protein
MVTLPCVFQKMHDKVTKNQQQNSAFAVRFWLRRTAKSPLCRAFLAQVHGKDLIFAVRFAPGARQRVPHAVCLRCRQLLFFAVRLEKTHGKDYLPCVVRRGARQRGFTVQNATVRPLPCAPTKNARQRVCRVF